MPLSAEPVRRIAVVSRQPGGDRGRRTRTARGDLRGRGVEIVEAEDAELAVVLGGDGTMLRALQQFLGTAVPVIGVNFGRVGFLSAMSAGGDGGRARAARSPASGGWSSCRRSTSTWTASRRSAINDVVCATSAIGRMVELDWSVGGEDLGVQPCDGVICATPTGSTAYNLSSGGPVLVWGLDAMAVTFVSPHSLHARPLVVPRGLELTVRNVTARRPCEGDRRRPAGRRPRRRTDGDGPARRAPRPARAAARDDLLPPLPRDLCLRSLRIENLVLIREAELGFAPGLNVITGETGAGKTILAQAIGLLLGAKGDAAYVGPGRRPRRTSRRSSTCPAGLLEEEAFEALAELRPDDEEGVVLARRIGSEGRTRAYAWGRSAAREDVAALGERLLAMSGQFEQRRLARPAYQLAVLDAFCGDEQLRRRAEARLAWRELGGRAAAARGAHARRGRGRGAAGRAARAGRGHARAWRPAHEDALREERERLRHLTELVEGAAAAAEALDPDDGEGAAGLTAAAERSLAPVERLAPELQKAADELRDAELRLREAASALRSFLGGAGGRPGPARAGRGASSTGSPTRGGASAARPTEELLARAAEARAELEALDQGARPGRGRAGGGRSRRRPASAELAGALREARAAAAEPVRGGGRGRADAASAWATASSAWSSASASPGATGADEATFLIRPNAGPAVRAGRRDRVRRRALPRRARDRRGRRRRDDGLRRDRRRDRRDDRARRRRHARAAGRPRAGDHDHAPAADREPRRPALPRREDPGRPDAHAHPGAAADERKEELERMLGGREFLATARAA